MATGRIFLLMGKSTSGKDTIYKNLITDGDLALKKVVPYTTRPMRDGETDGVQYFFRDEEGYLDLKGQGRIIEERTYYTHYGEWRYFTVDDGQIDLGNGSNYLVIGTLESYCSFRDYFGKDNVIPLLIDVEARIRLERAMKREEEQEHPKYDEMCRRFLADKADYSDERLEGAGITRTFDNTGELLDCIEEIEQFILADGT